MFLHEAVQEECTQLLLKWYPEKLRPIFLEALKEFTYDQMRQEAEVSVRMSEQIPTEVAEQKPNLLEGSNYTSEFTEYVANEPRQFAISFVTAMSAIGKANPELNHKQAVI